MTREFYSPGNLPTSEDIKRDVQQSKPATISSGLPEQKIADAYPKAIDILIQAMQGHVVDKVQYDAAIKLITLYLRLKPSTDGPADLAEITAQFLRPTGSA